MPDALAAPQQRHVSKPVIRSLSSDTNAIEVARYVVQIREVQICALNEQHGYDVSPGDCSG